MMRSLIILLAAGAASAAAPEPKCLKPEQRPALNGDPFTPVNCSSGTPAALPLPVEPPGAPAKPDLKALDGAWEGVLIRGIGRYASTLTVKTSWRGKAELALKWKEQQLRNTGETALSLAPAEGKGAYGAALTASLLPGASLTGTAAFSQEPGPDGKPRARLDLAFANGAAHRLRWSFPAKDVVRFAATWSVPEAPLQTLEGELRRVKR